MSHVETHADARDHLRHLIISRRMQPGDRLPSIRQLATKLGITIVAARDALVRAESEGLIEIRSRSGAFVRSAPPQEVIVSPRDEAPLRVVDGHQLYLCQAREVLEMELAGRAAQRARPEDLLPVRQALAAWLQANDSLDADARVQSDRRFHLAIAAIAGNPVMTGMLDQLLRQQLMEECSIPEAPDDRRRIIEIHQEIYEALRDRSVDGARDAMRRHMLHMERNILALLQATPDDQVSTHTARSRS